MKKIMILLISLFFLTGCSAEVNLLVKTNDKVEEKIQVQVPKKELYHFTSLEEAGKTYPKTYKNLLSAGKYKYNYKVQNDFIISTIQSKGNTLKTTTENRVYVLSYKPISLKKENGIKKFVASPSKNLTDYFSPNPDFDVAVLEKIKLNIQFHNVVQNSNADYYDSKTNTYTWEVTKENLSRNISFEITNEKRYDIISLYLWKTYGLLTIFIGIVALIGIIVLKRNQKRNDF